jgi:hypothetical protein
MARFVTVEVGCDWADCDVRRPEGSEDLITKTLSIDGKQAREFLLCVPKHLDAFNDTVLPLLQAGIPVTPPKTGRSKKSASAATSAGGDVVLPPDPDHPDTHVCQADVNGHPCGRPIRKRTGMAQHVIRSHGFESLEAYEAQYGPVT